MAFRLLNIEFVCHECGGELLLVKPEASDKLNTTFKVNVLPCKVCKEKNDRLANAIKDAIA